MRHELWGLRKIDTKERVYTYWASSNRHRALFARRDEAERACLNPRNANTNPGRPGCRKIDKSSVKPPVTA